MPQLRYRDVVLVQMALEVSEAWGSECFIQQLLSPPLYMLNTILGAGVQQYTRQSLCPLELTFLVEVERQCGSEKQFQNDVFYGELKLLLNQEALPAVKSSFWKRL